MAKYTYKEIKRIIEWTPTELKNKSTNEFETLLDLGYFHPSNANWSYQVKATIYKGLIVPVVFVFGWSK